MYPLDEALGGGIAYSRIFNCARVHGIDPDVYDFIPIQENAILNYNKFVRNSLLSISVIVKLDSDINYKLWEKLTISNQNFLITAINYISLHDRKTELEIVKI
ncbi:MAG: hypothetical protein HOP31_16690 [Ignavibacteria bacterium]|nr:hypothetical protein [Ignavibacteria bacterium]